MTTEMVSNTELDLTVIERTVVNAAHEALFALKKTFEHWTVIGRGLVALRGKADRMGGRKTFDRLREQAGIGQKLLDKTVVSKLLRMMDELPAVQTWRATLTEKEQFDWASPSAVLKHCPVFNKPTNDNDRTSPATSPVARMKQQVTDLQHETAHLREQLAAAEARDGSLFDLRRDRVEDIIATIVRTVSETRAKQIAAGLVNHFKKAKPAG